MEPGNKGRKHTRHHYGSIDVRNQTIDHDIVQQDVLNRKKPTVAWIFGSIALLCGFLAIFLRPSATTTLPSHLVAGDVEILGKVMRSPGDTPHPFSQRVDHLDPNNLETFQQRHYRKSEFFRGPGHPIILVVGGEGALDEGMFYPFVDTFLAEKFGAYVLHPGE